MSTILEYEFDISANDDISRSSLSNVTTPEWLDTLIENTPLPDVKQLVDFWSESSDSSVEVMTSVTRKFCSDPSCGRLAMLNDDACIVHNGMRENGKRSLRMKAKPLCKAAGCTKFSTTKGYCYHHYRSISYICTENGCYNQILKKGYCVTHLNKYNITAHARCSVDGCDRQVRNEGLCYKHGGGAYRCSKPDCTLLAKKDGLCRKHHPSYQKCIECRLFQVSENDNMCASCAGFRNNSPEYKVKAKLKEWFPTLNFIHNKTIAGSCLLYRPDFYLETDRGFALIIEVDEDQHDHLQAECEAIRLINMQQAISMPLAVIRFNPDVFKPDGITTVRITEFTKFEHLRDVIQSYMILTPIFEPGIPFIQYLRYSKPRMDELHRAMDEKLSLIR